MHSKKNSVLSLENNHQMQLTPITLETVKRKITTLVKKYELAKQESEILKGENEQLAEIIKLKDSQLQDFQNREKINKIVSNVTEEGDERTTELKLKINEYIKEIDKCIAHLSE